MSRLRDLKRFASRYGFRRNLLQQGLGYRIANAPYDFDGTVNVIRLEQVGRFGNVVLQLLNAILMARRLGCTTIELFRFEGAPTELAIGGLSFRFVDASDPDVDGGPLLVGSFLESFHFGDVLDTIPPDVLSNAIELYLKPLFADARNRGRDEGDDRTLVVHFRAGDVFQGAPVHPWYVQPPASYYETAILHAQAAFGTDRCVLVFEDRGNPAIAATERFLDANRIPFRVQSDRFEADLACLLGARHLVASYGTLCEAAALLSNRLRSYVAFRTFESQEHLYARSHPLLHDILAPRGVTRVLIEDMGGDYIPRRDWQCSAEQLAIIRDYPIARLSLAVDPLPFPYRGPRLMLTGITTVTGPPDG